MINSTFFGLKTQPVRSRRADPGEPVLECPLEGVTSPRRVAGPQRGPAFLDHQVDDDTLPRGLEIDIEWLVVDHRLA